MVKNPPVNVFCGEVMKSKSSLTEKEFPLNRILDVVKGKENIRNERIKKGKREQGFKLFMATRIWIRNLIS